MDGRGKGGDETMTKMLRNVTAFHGSYRQTYGHSSSKKENNLRKWKTEVVEEFLELR